jgi:hypothetical protein
LPPELLPSPNRLTVRIIEQSPSSHADRSSPCRRTPSSTPEPRRATGSTHLAATHRRAILLIYGEPPPPLLCLESIAFAHLLLSPVQPSRALLAAVQASPVQSATVPRSLPRRSCVVAPPLCATLPPRALHERLAERMRCTGCLAAPAVANQRRKLLSYSILVHFLSLKIHRK